MRAAIAVLTALTTTPAAAIDCYPVPMVEGTLKDMGRLPALSGTDANGDGVTIYLDPATREWTLVAFPSGMKGAACPVASGTDMRPVLAGSPS